MEGDFTSLRRLFAFFEVIECNGDNQRPAYGIVPSLCSNLVEVIQHFASRPQHYNTQRDNQKGGHFSISSSAAAEASYAAASRSLSSA